LEIHSAEYFNAGINLRFVWDKKFLLPLGDNVGLHFIGYFWWQWWSILHYF